MPDFDSYLKKLADLHSNQYLSEEEYTCSKDLFFIVDESTIKNFMIELERLTKLYQQHQLSKEMFHESKRRLLFRTCSCSKDSMICHCSQSVL